MGISNVEIKARIAAKEKEEIKQELNRDIAHTEWGLGKSEQSYREAYEAFTKANKKDPNSRETLATSTILSIYETALNENRQRLADLRAARAALG